MQVPDTWQDLKEVFKQWQQVPCYTNAGLEVKDF